jgi:Mce-associated membrane protein
MPELRMASWRSPRFRTALVVLLVVTTVGTAALLGWAITSRGEAEEVQAQREEVMAAGEQFMLRKETFGPEQLDDRGAMPEYRERVEEVITPKFETSFDEQAKVAEQLVAQSGLESSVEVYSTGVMTLDDDSAEVLAVGDTTFRFQEAEPRIAPFRYQLSLVLTDGEWLVDAFEPASEALP